MDITEYIENRKRIEKELAENGKKLLHGHLQDFMDKHPRIASLRWTQYTPFFNDGDPCVFGVHGLTFKAEGAADEEETEDAEETEYGDGYLCEYDSVAKKEYKAELEAVVKLEEQLGSQELEPVCQDAFGDHVRVTVVRKNGKVIVETEDYEHD